MLFAAIRNQLDHAVGKSVYSPYGLALLDTPLPLRKVETKIKLLPVHHNLTIDRIDRFLNAACASELALQTAPDIQPLIAELQMRERKAAQEIDDLKRRRDQEGLRETARQLGIDPSNLRRKLFGR